MDYDALDRLAKLRDSGAITDEEFDTRKAQLIEASPDGLDPADRPGFGVRVKDFLAKAETFYLKVLRGVTLVIATVLVGYAGWLGLAGLYGLSRNAASVEEEPVSVAAKEVADVDLSKSASPMAATSAAPTEFQDQKRFYGGALDQYYRLFQTSFEKFRKDDDKSLTKADFDKRFLNIEERIGALKSGDFDFTQDRADLTGLIAVMKETAALPVTQQRLAKYRSAQKTRIEEKVSRTRNETYCSYYGYYIDQCILYDTRPVKYTETKVSLKLPDGVISHVDLFGAYQRKYLETLVSRRETSQQRAKMERERILAANEMGRQSMWTAVSVAGAFIVLMFFFLLIAIERHQRKLAADPTVSRTT
ncbi:MAG: SHOCT domain-containing protein [Candidatus Binataceae bacterium]